MPLSLPMQIILLLFFYPFLTERLNFGYLCIVIERILSVLSTRLSESRSSRGAGQPICAVAFMVNNAMVEEEQGGEVQVEGNGYG